MANYSTFTMDECRQLLAAYERAYSKLVSGERVTKATYSQAGGTRVVEFLMGSMEFTAAMLQNEIMVLQRLTGNACARRRAIGFRR